MSEAWIGLIAAIITGLLSLIGVWISNHKGQALIAYRIDKLEETVSKHNQVADRVTNLEGRMTAVLEDLKELKRKI